MDVRLAGRVDRPADAVDLGKYPGLTYAPAQHGEGIRFAASGRPVADLVPAIDAAELAADLDIAARGLGVSLGDLCDGLKYLRDQRLI